MTRESRSGRGTSVLVVGTPLSSKVSRASMEESPGSIMAMFPNPEDPTAAKRREHEAKLNAIFNKQAKSQEERRRDAENRKQLRDKLFGPEAGDGLLASEFNRLKILRRQGGAAAVVDHTYQSNVHSIIQELFDDAEGISAHFHSTHGTDQEDPAHRRPYPAPIRYLTDEEYISGNESGDEPVSSKSNPFAQLVTEHGPSSAEHMGRVLSSYAHAVNDELRHDAQSAADRADAAVVAKPVPPPAQRASAEEVVSDVVPYNAGAVVEAQANTLQVEHAMGVGLPSPHRIDDLTAILGKKEAYEQKIRMFREIIGYYKELQNEDVLGDVKMLKAENRFLRKERIELYTKLYGHLLRRMDPPIQRLYSEEEEAQNARTEQIIEAREAILREEVAREKERFAARESFLSEQVRRLENENRTLKRAQVAFRKRIVAQEALEAQLMAAVDRDAAVDSGGNAEDRLAAQLADLEEDVAAKGVTIESLTMNYESLLKRHERVVDSVQAMILEHEERAQETLTGEEDAAWSYLQLRAAEPKLEMERLQDKVEVLRAEKMEALERLYAPRVDTGVVDAFLEAAPVSEMLEVVGSAGEGLTDTTLSDKVPLTQVADRVCHGYFRCVRELLGKLQAVQPHLPESDAQDLIDDLPQLCEKMMHEFASNVRDALDTYIAKNQRNQNAASDIAVSRALEVEKSRRLSEPLSARTDNLKAGGSRSPSSVQAITLDIPVLSLPGSKESVETQTDAWEPPLVPTSPLQLREYAHYIAMVRADRRRSSLLAHAATPLITELPVSDARRASTVVSKDAPPAGKVDGDHPPPAGDAQQEEPFAGSVGAASLMGHEVGLDMSRIVNEGVADLYMDIDMEYDDDGTQLLSKESSHSMRRTSMSPKLVGSSKRLSQPRTPSALSSSGRRRSSVDASTSTASMRKRRTSGAVSARRPSAPVVVTAEATAAAMREDETASMVVGGQRAPLTPRDKPMALSRVESMVLPEGEEDDSPSKASTARSDTAERDPAPRRFSTADPEDAHAAATLSPKSQHTESDAASVQASAAPGSGEGQGGTSASMTTLPSEAGPMHLEGITHAASEQDLLASAGFPDADNDAPAPSGAAPAAALEAASSRRRKSVTEPPPPQQPQAQPVSTGPRGSHRTSLRMKKTATPTSTASTSTASTTTRQRTPVGSKPAAGKAPPRVPRRHVGVQVEDLAQKTQVPPTPGTPKPLTPKKNVVLVNQETQTMHRVVVRESNGSPQAPPGREYTVRARIGSLADAVQTVQSVASTQEKRPKGREGKIRVEQAPSDGAADAKPKDGAGSSSVDVAPQKGTAMGAACAPAGGTDGTKNAGGSGTIGEVEGASRTEAASPMNEAGQVQTRKSSVTKESTASPGDAMGPDGEPRGNSAKGKKASETAGAAHSEPETSARDEKTAQKQQENTPAAKQPSPQPEAHPRKTSSTAAETVGGAKRDPDTHSSGSLRKQVTIALPAARASLDDTSRVAEVAREAALRAEEEKIAAHETKMRELEERAASLKDAERDTQRRRAARLLKSFHDEEEGRRWEIESEFEAFARRCVRDFESALVEFARMESAELLKSQSMSQSLVRERLRVQQERDAQEDEAFQAEREERRQQREALLARERVAEEAELEQLRDRRQAALDERLREEKDLAMQKERQARRMQERLAAEDADLRAEELMRRHMTERKLRLESSLRHEASILAELESQKQQLQLQVRMARSGPSMRSVLSEDPTLSPSMRSRTRSGISHGLLSALERGETTSEPACDDLYTAVEALERQLMEVHDHAVGLEECFVREADARRTELEAAVAAERAVLEEERAAATETLAVRDAAIEQQRSQLDQQQQELVAQREECAAARETAEQCKAATKSIHAELLQLQNEKGSKLRLQQKELQQVRDAAERQQEEAQRRLEGAKSALKAEIESYKQKFARQADLMTNMKTKFEKSYREAKQDHAKAMEKLKERWATVAEEKVQEARMKMNEKVEALQAEQRRLTALVKVGRGAQAGLTNLQKEKGEEIERLKVTAKKEKEAHAKEVEEVKAEVAEHEKTIAKMLKDAALGLERERVAAGTLEREQKLVQRLRDELAAAKQHESDAAKQHEQRVAELHETIAEQNTALHEKAEHDRQRVITEHADHHKKLAAQMGKAKKDLAEEKARANRAEEAVRELRDRIKTDAKERKASANDVESWGTRGKRCLAQYFQLHKKLFEFFAEVRAAMGLLCVLDEHADTFWVCQALANPPKEVEEYDDMQVAIVGIMQADAATLMEFKSALTEHAQKMKLRLRARKSVPPLTGMGGALVPAIDGPEEVALDDIIPVRTPTERTPTHVKTFDFDAAGLDPPPTHRTPTETRPRSRPTSAPSANWPFQGTPSLPSPTRTKLQPPHLAEPADPDLAVGGVMQMQQLAARDHTSRPLSSLNRKALVTPPHSGGRATSPGGSGPLVPRIAATSPSTLGHVGLLGRKSGTTHPVAGRVRKSASRPDSRAQRLHAVTGRHRVRDSLPDMLVGHTSAPKRQLPPASKYIVTDP